MRIEKLIKILIAIIVFIGIVTIIYFKLLFPSPISKDRMENEFSKNRDILQSIAVYLEKQEYTDIYITATDSEGDMLAYNNDTNEGAKVIPISDDFISKNITDLFKKHNYSIITKCENGVYFQRWSNRDYGRGVVYSIDGEQPQNEFLTKLEPLNENNWYFYEEK